VVGAEAAFADEDARPTLSLDSIVAICRVAKTQMPDRQPHVSVFVVQLSELESKSANATAARRLSTAGQDLRGSRRAVSRPSICVVGVSGEAGTQPWMMESGLADYRWPADHDQATFLIVSTGDRYGEPPLPARNPGERVRDRVQPNSRRRNVRCGADGTKRDENALLPEYLLQSTTGEVCGADR